MKLCSTNGMPYLAKCQRNDEAARHDVSCNTHSVYMMAFREANTTRLDNVSLTLSALMSEASLADRLPSEDAGPSKAQKMLAA